jgi:NADPH-dependent glutamate synthase beta subunit-like oxidoreductase/CO/xanthine dehydrogenase FAD-binding subunit
VTFTYRRAGSLEEAVELLAAQDGVARPVAGGTDVYGLVKERVHGRPPDVLVDLKGVPGLDVVAERDGQLAVGSLVRIAELERDPLVRSRFPALAEAAHAVASPQLRNMGTVGGNLCQEPRCWYYRAPEDTFDCTRKGGRYCNALTGDSRYHSIAGSMKVVTRPCSGACPGGVEIPEYMELLRAGDVDGAARRLLAHNPVPAVTGRVCPHTCEDECNRGLFDEAVSVREVERYLGDHVLTYPELLGEPGESTGHTVAVVGSGPAGLSAAYYLRLRGHAVTVFERAAEAGGMLRYGIPEYRLPRDVLRRTVELLESLGVDVRTCMSLGETLDVGALRAEFDRVFVATGAWALPGIGLEGEDELGAGLSFLSAVANGDRRVPGPHVLVIGGGSVAMDVAVTARRLGAERVTVACLEAYEEMPALLDEVEEALAEGIELVPSCGPARVLRDAQGALCGIELVRCTSVFDEQACFAPAFDESSREAVAADEVILAVGQRVDTAALLAAGLQADGGRLTADPVTQRTAAEGVYAGGDVVTGPSTVIAALAAGRRAALAIDAELAGSGAQQLVAVAAPIGVGEPVPVAASAPPGEAAAFQSCDPGCVVRSPRAAAALRRPEERTVCDEDCRTLEAGAVSGEAARCFNCGCVAASPSDLAPVFVALDAAVVTTARRIPAGAFFAASPGGSTVLAPGELVLEVVVPASAAARRCGYRKFRLRNAIDFPIVSAAVSFAEAGGVVVDARVVLGAAAPVPLRLPAVEEVINGRALADLATDEVARAVAASVAAACSPLPPNRYKTHVAGTMVVRALRRSAGMPEHG